ncbi:MAG TPA: hypothetical protein VGC81_13775 [Candidatus Methylomirabilis sp.]
MGGIAGTFLTLLAQLWVGGTAALLLVPMVGIGWGFYRTTTGIYLGIAVLALWVRIWLLLHAVSGGGAASGQVASSTAVPGTLALGASAILTLAFLVSLWGKHPVWSRRLLWAASLAGVAGLGLDAIAIGRDGSALVLSALLANAWLSSALLGLTFTGMLLGHWYLNEAGLPTRHVWRMAHWFLVAVLAQGLFPIAHGLVAVAAGDPARAAEVLRVIPEHPILLGGRVLIGCVATLVIALVIRNTLRIPNVQSATGFFYIAILTVLLGEVLGRALLLFTGVPF